MFLNGCEKEKWRRRVLYCGYGLSNLCLKSWLFQNRSIRSSSIRKRRKQKYYMFHAIYIYIRMNGVYTLNNSRQTMIYRQYILGSNNEKVHIFKMIEVTCKNLQNCWQQLESGVWGWRVLKIKINFIDQQNNSFFYIILI